MNQETITQIFDGLYINEAMVIAKRFCAGQDGIPVHSALNGLASALGQIGQYGSENDARTIRRAFSLEAARAAVNGNFAEAIRYADMARAAI